VALCKGPSANVNANRNVNVSDFELIFRLASQLQMEMKRHSHCFVPRIFNLVRLSSAVARWSELLD